MVTGPMLIVIFLVAIVFVMVSIMKYKVNPFISLLLTSIVVGLLTGMPLKDIADTIAKGFGGTMQGIGIVIALGVILGQILHETRCTEQIAAVMLRMVGKQNSPLAVNLTGYFVSIPVFFDAAFVILMPLLKQLRKMTNVPLITYVTALAVGLITTHALVIPTPGPVAVAGNMKVDIGWFLLYSIIISLPAALIGGWVYALRLGKKAVDEPTLIEEDELPVQDISSEKPSGSLAIFLVLFPIFLILSGTVMAMFLSKTSPLFTFFAFIGDKNIALFIGVILGIITLRKYFLRPLEEAITDAGKATGMIFLITGAGGSLGAIINATGIGKYLVTTMQSWHISVLVLAFVLSQILRAAQGSTTVALVTTSAILAPVTIQMGASPVLVGLAICCGGIGLSLPNDSGFWVVNRFSKLSLDNTIKAWTIGGTIAGVVGFIGVLILNLFSNVLPGL